MGICRERMDSGEPVDPDAVIRDHPELASELRVQFAALRELVCVFGSAAGAATAGPAADRAIGPYRLVREVGRGGQAVVWLAQDTRLPRRVALKVFAPGLAPSETLLARFRREADAASRLDHPGICAVLDAGVDEATPWIAMRFVEGRTLAQWIDEARAAAASDGHTTSVDLPASREATSAARASHVLRVAAVVEKAARALHFAHEAGLLHRDVKPGNVMVTPEGEPVLLDFGLARAELADLTLTATGALLGTPAYMSPEQLVPEDGRLDCRSDVYSLGVALYECLTLKLPFDAPTREATFRRILASEVDPPRRLNPQVPRDLETIVLTAMERDRERRYRTALDLAEDLRRLREHEPILARPTPPHVRLSRMMQRHPAVATAAVAAIALLATALGITGHFLAKSREEQGRTQQALVERTAALRRARALALTSASKAEAAANPMRALILARESVRTDPTRDSVDQLREAIFRSLERAVLRGHEAPLTHVAVSPSGDRVVTTSRDGTARLFDLDGRCLAVLSGHQGEVDAAAFVPDGSRVVTASQDGTARVWGAGGELVATLSGHAGPVVDVEVTGERILTASTDGTVRVWDAAGAELAVLEAHSRPLTDLALSPHGDRVATASIDGICRLWDLSGRQLAVMRVGTSTVHRVAFSPGGDRIATVGADRAVLWDADGREVAELRGHASTVTDADFSPRGDRLVTASVDGTARIWDLSGRQLAVLRGHAGRVDSARFSPTGSIVATGSADGTGRLWDLTGKEIAVLDDHTKPVRCIAFAPRGDRVVTASSDATARVWATRACEVAVLTGHEDRTTHETYSSTGDLNVWRASVSPDCGRIVAASPDRTARVWDGSGGEVASLTGHAAAVRWASFSAGGDRIVTASDDATARVWDAAGKCLAVLPGHPWVVTSASFDPGGGRIVTTCLDGSVRVWDAAGAKLAELLGHTGQVRSASFSPDGTRVVTASDDQTARLWDVSGRPLATFAGHRGRVYAAAFSGDGGRVVTASEDRTARTWTAAGAPLVTLSGHEGRVHAAAFSPVEDLLVTASEDGTARLWDDTGRELVTLKARGGTVWSAAFTPAGDRVVTVTDDGTAFVWAVHDADVLALADRRILREFTFEERRRFAGLLGLEGSDEIEAGRVVARLSQGDVVDEELADAVRADASLTDGVRAAALRIVAARAEDLTLINAAEWGVVKRPGRTAQEYLLAVRRLSAAARLTPFDEDLLNTLGAAQYRAGLFAEALATLTRSDSLSARRDPPGIVEDTAFLAMCLHHLGRTDEARRCLDRLHEIAKYRRVQPQSDAQALVKEAEAVVGR